MGLSHANRIAFILIAVMCFLLVFSILNEPPIIDEVPHIAAGFGYVTQLDYRLNPEHPPLIKALGALSAWIFARPHFPTDTRFWQTDVNGQWDQGAFLLYDAGNNPDKIIFWARIPVILLTCLLGWLIYWFSKKRFGAVPALIALALYSLSPTILAHGRYLTTDLGAAFGFFIGIITFINFLQQPTRKNIIIAGGALGIALLFKFSTFLLIPMDLGLLFLWAVISPTQNFKERLGLFMRRLGKTILLALIAVAIVGAMYGIFVLHYPQKRQLADANYLLGSYGFRPAVNLDLTLIKNSFTRPLGQYLLGLLMVQQRAAGGNTAYFLGEVSSVGSRLYFPLLYLVKEPVALHLLTVIALLWALRTCRAWRSRIRARANINALGEGIYRHFPEWSLAFAIAFYWAVSIKSPLNIGIRHVIPTFPFIYILVARGVSTWLKGMTEPNPAGWAAALMAFVRPAIRAIPKYIILALLLVWLFLGTVSTTPHFLAYYNEFGGGVANGWKIATDSNYDWGQDLKRLADFVQENNIQKIKVDYFGWARPQYYLGNHYEPWSSSRGPATGWYAISATFRQGAFGAPAPGFVRKPEDGLEWLKPYPPIARAGYSIFIYKLPEEIPEQK